MTPVSSSVVLRTEMSGAPHRSVAGWAGTGARGRAGSRRRCLGVEPPRYASADTACRLGVQGVQFLGERGELELVCRGARVLVGEEEGGIGDPARVGQRFRRDTGARGPVERLDARVDD